MKENLNLMEERGGLSPAPSTHNAPDQNRVTQAQKTGGNASADTTFDTTPKRPWTPGQLWRSIETAPKDGTRIVATSMGSKPHVYYWRGGDFNNWCIDYADGAGWQPTHWKPFEDGTEESLFEALEAALEALGDESCGTRQVIAQARAAMNKALGRESGNA